MCKTIVNIISQQNHKKTAGAFGLCVHKTRVFVAMKMKLSGLVLLYDLNRSLSAESHTTMMELSILFNHCDHLLLTVGTFSYWAGWKSVGHVLASSIQMYSFKNKGTAYTKAEDEHFFPPNFRLIKQCDGEVDKF